MSVFGVFLVRIFPHSEWIRRDTLFSPNAVKYRPEKPQTLFPQCKLEKKVETYPLQVTKSPWLQNLTSETNESQSVIHLHCVKTSISRLNSTTKCNSNKENVEFMIEKLEMQLNEIRKIQHKNYLNNCSIKMIISLRIHMIIKQK